MIALTRRYRFSASHRLHSKLLPEPENAGLYGKCNNPYGHGHDYVLEVTAAGPLDESTGRVCNPAIIDLLVQRCVLSDLDHRNLNEDVRDFQNTVPTSENLAAAIHRRLASAWPAAFPGEWPLLQAVRLRETRKNSFELRT